MGGLIFGAVVAFMLGKSFDLNPSQILVIGGGVWAAVAALEASSEI